MPRGVPNAKKDELGMKYTTFHAPLLYVLVYVTRSKRLNKIPIQGKPQAHSFRILEERITTLMGAQCAKQKSYAGRDARGAWSSTLTLRQTLKPICRAGEDPKSLSFSLALALFVSEEHQMLLLSLCPTFLPEKHASHLLSHLCRPGALLGLSLQKVP